MMTGVRIASIAAARHLLASPVPAKETSQAEISDWVDGRWLDDERFVVRTLISSHWISVPAKRPSRRVDLDCRFVVPSLADALHHGIDRFEGLDEKTATFLTDDIVCVKNPNVIPDYGNRRCAGA